MRKLRSKYIASLLILFALVLSLSTLPGPLAAQIQFPRISAARASPALATNWLPAGPSTNTEIQAIFSSDTSEQTAFLAETVDLTDVALTPTMVTCLQQTGTTCSGIPGVNPSHFAVTSALTTHDIFEIQVMEHNNYWGSLFNFGLDSGCTINGASNVGTTTYSATAGLSGTCPGVNIRQAVAHLIDKISFCANNGIVVCSAVDNDVPTSDGLIAPDPCQWDAMFPQATANCHVGAPGGTAYNLGATTGVGHDTGGVAATYPWEKATDNGGKADLCAAAAHLVAAGVAGSFSSTTCVLSALSANVAAHPVNIFARSDRPARLHLGDGLMEDLCYLFTGHFSDPTCQQIPTTTTACTGTCVVTETRGPFSLFPGFTTSKSTVLDTWWLYTGGFGGVFPFDSLLFGQYSSRFVSGVGAADQPPCSSLAVPTTGAANYQYTCVPTYDTAANLMEFSPCQSAVGDPSVTQTAATVTFANCSGTSALSAVSAAYQAQDLLGRLAMWNVIYGPSEQFGYLAKWNSVINSQGASIPNFFTWADASTSGTQTVTQGFAAPTKSINPYASSTVFDFQTIGVLYDSIGALNPLNNGQYFDFAASGHSTPCNTNTGVVCNLSSLGYTPPTGTVATLRFSLRPDIFWQSDSVGTTHPARPLTSYDVKFTYLTCKAAGSFQCGVLAPVLDVHILDKATFDLNLNAIGPFTLLSVTGPTILPGRYWSSTCPGATWDADLAAGAVPDSCMAVSSTMSTITFDPLISTPTNGLSAGILIGSSIFECQSAGGVVGFGCSSNSNGSENPPGGGSYTMTRFGCNRSTNTCNAPGANPTGTYFRSDGTLALAIWAGNNGDSNHDSVNVGGAAFCFGKAVGTAGCGQFQRGIGNPGCSPYPGCTVVASSVNVGQVSAVIRFAQDGNWVSPFNWMAGIPLSCCPFASNPPDLIQSATPVLIEGTATLNPCSVDTANGYDC